MYNFFLIDYHFKKIKSMFKVLVFSGYHCYEKYTNEIVFKIY